MTVTKTHLTHLKRLLDELTQSEALSAHKIELHIGTGLLYELAEEIIAEFSPLNGPPLTISDLKNRHFSLYNIPVIPSLTLGPNFQIIIFGGPTVITHV